LAFRKIIIKKKLDKLPFQGIAELCEEKVVNEHPNPLLWRQCERDVGAERDVFGAEPAFHPGNSPTTGLAKLPLSAASRPCA